VPDIIDDDVAIQEVLAEINQVQDATATNVQMQQPYNPPPVTMQPPKVQTQAAPVPPQPGMSQGYEMPPPGISPGYQPPYYVVPPPPQAPAPPTPGLMDSVTKHLWEVCKNDLILFAVVFAATFLVNTEQIENVLRVYLANMRFPYAAIVVKALLAAVAVIALKRFLEA